MLRVLPVLIVLGVLIYLLIRLVQRRGGGGGGGGGGGVRPRKPIAPDDDPTFLRDLDAQLWEQQQRERREREQQDDPPPATPT